MILTLFQGPVPCWHTAPRDRSVMSLPVTLSLRLSHLNAKYRVAPVRAMRAAVASQTDRLNGRVKMFITKESGGWRKMKAFLQRHMVRSVKLLLYWNLCHGTLWWPRLFMLLKFRLPNIHDEKHVVVIPFMCRVLWLWFFVVFFSTCTKIIPLNTKQLTSWLKLKLCIARKEIALSWRTCL